MYKLYVFQILVDYKNTAFGIKMKRGGQIYTVLAKKEVNFKEGFYRFTPGPLALLPVSLYLADLKILSFFVTIVLMYPYHNCPKLRILI